MTFTFTTAWNASKDKFSIGAAGAPIPAFCMVRSNGHVNTSNLDSYVEQKVHSTYKDVRRYPLVVYVTHRKS